MGSVSPVKQARSIWFVLFIWLIWFIWLVSFNRPNETNQITVSC
jgi:hypothetical protein